MNRIGNSVDKTTLISMYYAYVNSHISNLIPIWGHSATESLLNALQVAQNQALRALFRADYYANGLGTRDIRGKYNILSVRQNINYNTAMLAYKIKNNLLKTNILMNTVNQMHSYSTRGADSLYQRGFRTNSGKHLISRVTAIEFNKLPINIQNSQTLATFKKHTKAHILNTQQW